jgi:hypothetical protein
MSKPPNRKPSTRAVKKTRAAKTPRNAPAEVAPLTPRLSGRHTKCSPELTQAIIDGIRIGCSMEVAAQANGVGRTTLLGWRARGEAELIRFDRLCDAAEKAGRDVDAIHLNEREAQFVDFYLALLKAEAVAESSAVFRLYELTRKGAEFKPGQWQAIAWWLERRHPERWGRKDRTEPTQTIDFGLRIESVEVTATTTPGASGEVLDVNGAIVAQASRYAHLVSSTAD